jgi:hypothetical protein
MRKRVSRMFYEETGEETPGISNVLSLTSLDIRGFHKHTEETQGNDFSTS